jgi:TonB-dependent starch-binding outer membrane protein SusC
MFKRIFLAIMLVHLVVLLATAQSLRITGTVLDDSSNVGLPNVSVVVNETKKGTSTDKDGKFTINVTGHTSVTLTATYVGYRTTTATANGSTPVVIQLRKESAQMEDVVVIGYQTVRRKDVLGSVSSIGAKDLKDVPLTSAAEALNGRLAGVTATTSEGSPDANVRIRVRGGISITQNNDPLYIVDGVQVENALNVIAPQDIQSIDVLKDASATAIYGARGANGVIVITTKTGKPGRTVISYNGFVGVRSLAKKLPVMSPYDYVLFQYERTRSSSSDSGTFAGNFGTTWDTLQNYRNVTPIDWQEKILGNTGISTTHNINASGGNKKATYNFGYTFNKEKPVVINSNFTRHILNLKGDYKITKKLKVGAGARYTNQSVTGAGTSSGESSSSFGRLRNAVKYRPFLGDSLEIDDPDPLVVNPGNSLQLVNPIALADAEYRRKTTVAYNLNANASYQILKGLSFRSTFGYDHNDFTDRQFFDSITGYSINQGGRKPIVHLDTVYKRVFTNSNVLTFSKKGIRKSHDLDVLIGEETYQLDLESHSTRLRDFPNYISQSDAFEKTTAVSNYFATYPRTYKAKYTNLSFFSRINYAYKDKYLLSINGRFDGASKFAPGMQWGFFPGGSIAWRVKKEEFMRNVDFFSDLKVRLGYGKIGNNRIDDYLYITNFFYGNTIYGLNGQPVSAYTQQSLANANLQWESLVNRNLGIDMSLLKGRIDLSVDVYNNTSDKLLLNAKIAPTFGFTEQLQNIGATRNKGYEVQLNTIIVRKAGGFNWNASFNISHNTNTVEALAKGQTSFNAGPSWGPSGQKNDYVVQIGAPVGSMYGWVTDGFYKVSDFNYTQTATVNNQTVTLYTLKPGVAEMKIENANVVPGAIRFKDLNGDGVIDDNDRTIIGNPNPKFTGGLNQQFTYKNWDASLFVNFSFGNDVYNANKLEFSNAYNVTSNMLDIMSDRWKTVDANGNVLQKFAQVGGKLYAYGAAPDVLAANNANASIWMPAGLNNFGSGSGIMGFFPHSWAIEDGSFIRLNNLTVGYTLPIKSVTKMGMSKLRFYLTGNNLAIITNYTGFDPEVSVKSNGLTPGLDYSAFPKSRSFIFGVNATF